MVGAGLLVLSGHLPVCADDLATPPDQPVKLPPREEVVVERRIVVHDEDERPRERAGDIDRRLAELREHAVNLRSEGREDEAEHVVREIEKLEARMREGARPGGRSPVAPRNHGGIAELQRRLNHLHIAMENLRAAGAPDLAMEVEQHARELRRQLEAQVRRPRQDPEGPRGELEQVRREMAELREQLEDLRRAVRPPPER